MMDYFASLDENIPAWRACKSCKMNGGAYSLGNTLHGDRQEMPLESAGHVDVEDPQAVTGFAALVFFL